MQFAVVSTELKPLCPKHLQPMDRVDIYWKVEGSSAMNCMEGYRCAVDKCNLFYDVYSGYHERPDGTVGSIETQYCCKEHGLSMYVANHALRGAVKHYKCPQFACSHGESVHSTSA